MKAKYMSGRIYKVEKVKGEFNEFCISVTRIDGKEIETYDTTFTEIFNLISTKRKLEATK